ncbi:DUF7848 domain-containing protein [Actinacidiphila rubida]|uniref:DUF7848 domain-containing protein n=1 Tax=Actinacidiphila rubida TaxID=310780 RepID=A0A1H8L7X6_9ACTN|nr:hypothetical protein [Actinacidiphila rubida]SEO01213.1 hypothetical protein SAMN05216267_101584 [Actinacidiphila rubida]
MSRTVLRYVDWRIVPDDDESTPPITFQMECVACAILYGAYDAKALSPASEDFADVQDWALRHSGRNPEHTAFREQVHRYWKTYTVGGSSC